MNHTRKKVIVAKSKRLGRGYGSGKGGHTSGRGQKGQKSRGSIGVLFEGFKMRKSLIKRLPLRRGKAKFTGGLKPLIIKLAYLNLLDDGATVDIALLIKNKIVDAADAQKYGVKVLGDGELTKKLTIAVPISKSAAEKVKKAGGTIAKE